MGDYTAPLDDMTFIIDQLLNVEANLGQLPDYEDYDLGPELTGSLLGEAAKFSQEVLSPLRRVADQTPARCHEGKVSLSPGYAEAVRQLCDGGWLGVSAPLAHGGQGLPELYGTAACEIWNGADMAFALAPFLSIGAALAITAHGSDAQKAQYLEKMNSGTWLGTMNLTESSAGSDLSQMKTRAVREDDHFRVYGQKIFISWGDHEAAENLIHLVLARIPGAPDDSRGLSLFIVPKYLVNADGSLGARNDVYPLSCEHKMGIHGSPTCVMAFGENDGAVAYLLGVENRGLACMFTMMNEARLKVGLQALGTAEGAFQKALGYARERVQGGCCIIEHPDVKRMLLTMKSLTEAMRVFAYTESMTMDLANSGPELLRAQQRARIDLMIPVVKAWLTEMGQEVASLGIQVHGGLGYIEETGAAQFLRDVRITSIYEGTNGIQAGDLVARKLARDGGLAMQFIVAEITDDLARLERCEDQQLRGITRGLAKALAYHQDSTQTILRAFSKDPAAAAGASFDYLMQTGYLFGGWQLARSALVAWRELESGSPRDFYKKKIYTSAYYSEQILPRCASHAGAIESAMNTLRSYPIDWI